MQIWKIDNKIFSCIPVLIYVALSWEWCDWLFFPSFHQLEKIFPKILRNKVKMTKTPTSHKHCHISLLLVVPSGVDEASIVSLIHNLGVSDSQPPCELCGFLYGGPDVVFHCNILWDLLDLDPTLCVFIDLVPSHLNINH